MTIKEYAKKKGVSYEAVRKQLKRYAEELEGHISKDHNITVIDEYAVDFLDNRRKINHIVVYEQNENELLKKIVELQDELKKTRDQLHEAEKEKLMLENKAELKALEDQNVITEIKNELEITKARLDDELGKSFLQRLFGR